jgi:hypothetical protein
MLLKHAIKIGCVVWLSAVASSARMLSKDRYGSGQWTTNGWWHTDGDQVITSNGLGTTLVATRCGSLLYGTADRTKPANQANRFFLHRKPTCLKNRSFF